jgi:hypothetical protein
VVGITHFRLVSYRSTTHKRHIPFFAVVVVVVVFVVSTF